MTVNDATPRELVEISSGQRVSRSASDHDVTVNSHDVIVKLRSRDQFVLLTRYAFL